MRTALPTQPGVTPPPFSWTCVVERDQIWRDNKSGVLFEVLGVLIQTSSVCDASVTLRPVEAQPGDEDLTIKASVLCAGGGAWTRLPDDGGETTFWAG